MKARLVGFSLKWSRNEKSAEFIAWISFISIISFSSFCWLLRYKSLITVFASSSLSFLTWCADCKFYTIRCVSFFWLSYHKTSPLSTHQKYWRLRQKNVENCTVNDWNYTTDKIESKIRRKISHREYENFAEIEYDLMKGQKHSTNFLWRNFANVKGQQNSICTSCKST